MISIGTIDRLHEFAREQFVWLKQFSVAHCVAWCHWKVCNSCPIKTVQRCSLCGVLWLKRVYWQSKTSLTNLTFQRRDRLYRSESDSRKLKKPFGLLIYTKLLQRDKSQAIFQLGLRRPTGFVYDVSHSLIYLTAYCRSTRRSACKEHGHLTCAAVEGQLIDMCDDYLSHYVAGTRHVNYRRGAIICYRYPANYRHLDNAGVMLGHRRKRWPNNKPTLGRWHEPHR